MGSERFRLGLCALVTAAIALAGCANRKDVSELHYLGDADDRYYKGIATSIEYPDTEDNRPDEISASTAPHTIADRHKDQIWDMTLQQALQLALANNKVIRSASQFATASNGLMVNPNGQESIYDPAIQETGVLFGSRGVEAALADFDTQFALSTIWGHNETVQNNTALAGGLPAGAVLAQDTAVYNASLQKIFANGGTLQLSNQWNYLGTNAPVLFPSSYNGFIQAQYTQPLWAGAGVEYTRIAGPVGSGFTGVTGVAQGVVIARINNDLALADFEIASLNLLRDTENSYWDLYLSYRLHHTAVVAHNSALRSWREADAKLKAGGIAGFTPVDEAQARDQLFSTRATYEQTLSDLYTNETKLRRLLGLPVNDGRIIRPSDEPLSAKFVPNWYNSLTEGLTRRVELRKQKWSIKSLELQLKAARSLTNPQLNFVGSYRVNGFGDTLISDQSTINQPGSSAFAALAETGQTGWNLGFQFSMPIGFRQAHTQVRQYEIRVQKAREALAEQELEVAQELAASFQAIAAQFQTAQSNFNRRVAAEREVQLYQWQYEYGTTTLDFVLRAQSSLASAEQNYYTSLVNYAKAILDLNYRQGTLLDADNVALAESEWTPEAYRDAVRRAWARSHAIPADFLWTEPCEFVVPPGMPAVEGAPPSAAENGSNPVPPGPAEPPAFSPAPAPPAEPGKAAKSP